jgi:hypothetical protein
VRHSNAFRDFLRQRSGINHESCIEALSRLLLQSLPNPFDTLYFPNQASLCTVFILTVYQWVSILFTVSRVAHSSETPSRQNFSSQCGNTHPCKFCSLLFPHIEECYSEYIHAPNSSICRCKGPPSIVPKMGRSQTREWDLKCQLHDQYAAHFASCTSLRGSRYGVAL